MAFRVIHANDVVEVRQRQLVDGDRDAAVVCIFGNTATWTDIHDDWPESCTLYADICITVRDKTLDQTKYEESDFDPSSCIEAVGVAWCFWRLCRGRDVGSVAVA